MSQNIILFDGVCNFCNFWVKFVIKRDSKKQFKFASLQSEIGQLLLQENHILGEELNSVILLEDEQVYRMSSAALHISKKLDGGWKLLFLFIVIPPFIRDAIYNFVAKNRYRWFGKSDTCMIPNAELNERFL